MYNNKRIESKKKTTLQMIILISGVTAAIVRGTIVDKIYLNMFMTLITYSAFGLTIFNLGLEILEHAHEENTITKLMDLIIYIVIPIYFVLKIVYVCKSNLVNSALLDTLSIIALTLALCSDYVSRFIGGLIFGTKR